MSGEGRQLPAADTELRARALLALVPPLVHRLNNSLVVVQGVLELGARAPARDGAEARAELGLLGQVLNGLGELARLREARGELVDVQAMFRTCTVLLEPLAEQRGFALESSVGSGLVVRADPRVPWLFLCALLERLGAGERDARLRLRASARGPQALLGFALSVARTGAAGEAERLLAAQVAAAGGRLTPHASGRALALRLALPLVSAPGAARVPRVRPRRVLYLSGAGQEREIVSMLLGEHGFRVHETHEEPRAGVFDLALVEERLAQHDPGLCARLRSRFGLERVEVLQPRARPEELLERLAE